MIKKHKYGLATLLAVSVLGLAACGGSSGGGGDSTSGSEDGGEEERESDAPETSESRTVSGTVEVIDGTVAEARNWSHRVLAWLLSDARAAIGGLVDAPEGTAVHLIRIANDGSEVEELATTTTNADGRFTLEVDSDELGDLESADLVIEAGSSGDPVRAPAGGEDIVVNPVSSSIVNKVVARIQAGESAFADYRASDLANLVAIIIDELEASGETFSATSNSEAADEADDDAGNSDDDLLTSVEGENTLAENFVGEKNLAILDILLEGTGSGAGFAAINQTLSPQITSDGRLDAAGDEAEDSRTERTWSFDDAGGISNSFAQETTTETVGDNEDFAITVGKDGRLTALGNTIRGAVSDDGQLFAMAETRSELDGQGASFGIFAGAGTWTPGDVNETFNFVKFDGYVDEGANVGQVGFTNTLTGEATLACNGGDCSLDLDRFDAGSEPATARKFFAQVGPDEDNALDTGSSSNDGVLGLTGFSLHDGGRLTGEAAITVDGSSFPGDYRTRGFVAPGSRMLVAQLSFGGDDFPFEDFIVGLPKGDSCSAGTLDGFYNTVQLFGVLSDVAPRQIATESEAFTIEADGAGTIAIPGSRFREAVLTFDKIDGAFDAGLSRDVIDDAEGDTETYSVDADCKLTIADEENDRVLGAVSPDGDVFTIATYSREVNDGVLDETFQSIAIGIRRPAAE